MGLSGDIPWSYYDPLCEDVSYQEGRHSPFVSVRAVATFHDSINPMGQQYQYLQLEVSSTIDWPKRQVVFLIDRDRTKPWYVSQLMESTYTGSKKYICSDA